MRSAIGITRVSVAAALLAASLHAQQPPQPAPQPPAVKVMTAEEAIRQDARAYAAQFNVGMDEAVRRLKAQEQQGEVVGRLRAANRGRFAGLWVEHQPEFRIVVRLKGDAPAPPELNAAAANSPTRVAFVTGATATEDEVLAKIKASLPQFKAAFPGLGGTDADVRTGDIVLYVHATGEAATAARGKGAELAKQVGHPVRVELLAAPLRDLDVRGGANLTDCTTGFVVANTAGTRGFVTAGHCPDTESYSGFDGTNTSTTFVSEVRDADKDMQWHTTPVAEVPEFYADLTTSARVLTGRRLRTSTAAGNAVCHRGLTSGYSCGTVSSITYQPTYAGACPTTCNAVWISVTGPNLACSGGDSGGAWFNGQTAFGLMKAGSFTGSAPGQCSLAIYESTDYLSGLGVSLVYGP